MNSAFYDDNNSKVKELFNTFAYDFLVINWPNLKLKSGVFLSYHSLLVASKIELSNNMCVYISKQLNTNLINPIYISGLALCIARKSPDITNYKLFEGFNDTLRKAALKASKYQLSQISIFEKNNQELDMDYFNKRKNALKFQIKLFSN
jgi:hypothetical protein